MAISLIELRNRAVEKGLESVSHEENPIHRDGGKAGFEICRELLLPEQFEAKLREREQEAWQLRDQHDATKDQKDLDAYWFHRWGTIQIEFVYNIIKCGLRKGPLSARAALVYQEIVTGEKVEL
jgi:hypothetical protein